MDPTPLAWARRLQVIAQNGLTYARGDPYDIERYEAVRAIAAEMLASGTGVDAETLRALFARETGHATPKVDVRGAVFRDGRVLLVRERQDGLWTLPGGWADPGETPAASVVREVYEESGYRTRATRLLAVYDRDAHGHPPIPYAVYKLFFLCDIVAVETAEGDRDDAREAHGQPRGQAHGQAHGHGTSFAEITDVGFFAADALPALSLTRVLPAQIARMFALYRHPEQPTEFD